MSQQVDHMIFDHRIVSVVFSDRERATMAFLHPLALHNLMVKVEPSEDQHKTIGGNMRRSILSKIAAARSGGEGT